MTPLERLTAIQPREIDGELYWPRRAVIDVLAIKDSRALRQINAHPGAVQVTVREHDRRMFMPPKDFAYINLPAVLALVTCSPRPLSVHVVREALQRRGGATHAGSQ